MYALSAGLKPTAKRIKPFGLGSRLLFRGEAAV